MTKQISILLPPQVMPEGTVTWAAGEPLRALAQRVLPSVTLMLPLRFQQPLGPEVYTNLLLVEGSGQPAYGRDMDAPFCLGNAPTFVFDQPAPTRRGRALSRT